MFGKKDGNNTEKDVVENNDDLESRTKKTEASKEFEGQEQKEINNVEEAKEAEENKENDAVTKLEEENKKLKESLMRTLAELENTRRRAIEENEKTSRYAISRFAEDLIPVMENFYMAFDSTKDLDLSESKEFKNFFDGIKMTQSELKKVFDKNGLSRIYPSNEMFDHNFHEAIAQLESEAEEGTIVNVLQSGYKIKDRLLRPALVTVAKPKN